MKKGGETHDQQNIEWKIISLTYLIKAELYLFILNY